MSRRSKKQVIPRNGHTLMVVIVARISGCANQKELSLDDQTDHDRAVIEEIYEGPAEFIVIATRGKGERLDRPELKEVEDLIRTRTIDVIVMEDVGRLVRGVTAAMLWGLAVDHGTRCIAPNDCCDTNDESWEEDLISACRDHVGHNAHTSKRIKHKLMNRFVKYGGSTPMPTYGYIKPEDAETFDDWSKDPDARVHLQSGMALLQETLNCSAVADHFNARGVPVGPSCDNSEWDGRMIRRLYANPILKGMAARGTHETVKIHGEGRRVSRKNPDGPVYRACPHLAWFDAAEFDDVNARLTEKNARTRRGRNGKIDPRLRVPRKRTRFPGQHATCAYCGRIYVWGGNGVTENLQCTGSRDWRCWNSIGFNGSNAAQKVAQVITNELVQLNQFEAQFAAIVSNAANDSSDREQLDRVLRDLADLEQEKFNLAESMAACGPLPWIKEKVKNIEFRDAELQRTRSRLERQQKAKLSIPASLEELRRLLEEHFAQLAINSTEMGDLLRQIVPEFRVQLVRLCDGGHLMPRARVTLNLAGVTPDANRVPGLTDLLTRDVTLDLFEPPQREQIRVAATSLAAMGMTQRDIVRALPQRVTLPAVQKALALQRRMDEQGLVSPYVVLEGPPSDYPKVRRHKNPRYRFRPLNGHQFQA
ncbi:MAG: recombinase family protein [Planctomycetaceae bacterium]|nr:recombinase family protein [Planctomycetaceae bacterium]